MPLGNLNTFPKVVWENGLPVAECGFYLDDAEVARTALCLLLHAGE